MILTVMNLRFQIKIVVLIFNKYWSSVLVCYSSVVDECNKGSNIPGVRDDNMVILKSCKLEIPFYSKKKELKFLGEY